MFVKGYLNMFKSLQLRVLLICYLVLILIYNNFAFL